VKQKESTDYSKGLGTAVVPGRKRRARDPAFANVEAVARNSGTTKSCRVGFEEFGEQPRRHWNRPRCIGERNVVRVR